MPKDSRNIFSADDVRLFRSICPNPGKTNEKRVAAIQGQFKDACLSHGTCGPMLQSNGGRAERNGDMKSREVEILMG